MSLLGWAGVWLGLWTVSTVINKETNDVKAFIADVTISTLLTLSAWMIVEGLK